SGSSGSFSRSVSDRKHSTGCSTEGRCRRLCGVLQGRSTMQAARLLLHGEIRIKPLNSLARRAGDGRLGGAAATAVEGALLVVPGGALARVDRAVVIGVDLVEALAEAAVTIGCRQPGEPVEIGLGLFEPGPLTRLQIGGGELGDELGLSAFDVAQPPLTILLEADRVVGRGRRGGLRLGGSGRLRGLPRQP